ncbi:S1C family serine protease [Carboxydothermus ferrireducens]|uniref:S1-C subfamily serine protease n=1 Tax=Carboxydothermus ferrireducens DSM 11255 TaxID=1119529 RepID=A0ABX2RD77_9THEO|nr:trypsin-like peptidase domain-containing protein [Carboxydothermus ferrireducens]NYE57773.1 S1-C subfamily serine protease [Carboxydothermus ferrireducens DSM 11255]
MKFRGKFIVVFLLSLVLFNYRPVLAKTVNYPPQILTISASKTVVTSGESITLSAKAYDKNKDKIYYEWTVNGSSSDKGRFSSTRAAKVTWTAPKVTGDTYFTIKLKVYDSKKAAAYKSIKIQVKPKTLTQLFKELKDSTVLITTGSGLGSGFIISSDGRILTCYHVIKGEKQAFVTLANGTKYEVVSLERYDPENDWAIIKINARNLKPVALTTKLPEVGEQVFTIGNPQGLSWSMASGIVSSNNREIDGKSYLQITAPVNPGNSGGPLFNMKGEVIGIINMKLNGSEGLNFAIPYNTVLQNMNTAFVVNAPLAEVFSDETFQAGIDELVKTLNEGNYDYLNPLIIGSTNFGRVTYENGTWVDENTGAVHYGIDVVVNYQQFLKIYLNHQVNADFNNDWSILARTLTEKFSNYLGIPAFYVWFRVYEDLDQMPTENLVPAKYITPNNGKYTVDWYFYEAVSSFNDFSEKWY